MHRYIIILDYGDGKRTLVFDENGKGYIADLQSTNHMDSLMNEYLRKWRKIMGEQVRPHCGYLMNVYEIDDSKRIIMHLQKYIPHSESNKDYLPLEWQNWSPYEFRKEENR